MFPGGRRLRTVDLGHASFSQEKRCHGRARTDDRDSRGRDRGVDGRRTDLAPRQLRPAYARWWNPAVEDQASDRVHRIGQQRRVLVHTLLTDGTVEEHIARMHEQKRDLASVVTGRGAQRLRGGATAWGQVWLRTTRWYNGSTRNPHSASLKGFRPKRREYLSRKEIYPPRRAHRLNAVS